MKWFYFIILLIDTDLGAVNVSIQSQCENDGGNPLKTSEELQRHICNLEPLHLAGIISEKCFPQLKLGRELNEANFTIRKFDFCWDIQLLTWCVTDQLKTCNSDVPVKFFQKVLEPFLDSCGIQAVNSLSAAGNILQGLKGFIWKRCLTNAHQGVLLELDKIVKNATNHFSRISSPNDSREGITIACTEAFPLTSAYYEDFLTAFEPCLQAEEKYLPEFLLVTFKLTVEKFCVNGGNDIQKPIDGFSQEECALEEFGDFKMAVVLKCVSKLTFLSEFQTSSFVLTKSVLCGNIELLKQCLINETKMRCKGDKHAKFAQEAIEPILELCALQGIDY